MSATDHLNKAQFPRTKKAKPQKKAKFGGSPGGKKTMPVEKGKGLPAAQTVHQHRSHTAATKRAK